MKKFLKIIKYIGVAIPIIFGIAGFLILTYFTKKKMNIDIDEKIKELKKLWSKDNEKINDLNYDDTNDNGIIKSRVSRKTK